MAADLNFLQYFKTPDLVTPFSVGMEMAERNRNAKTQRMFAENQAKRQSAQDLREQQEFKDKQDEEKRKNDIEQAHALQTIGMLHPTNPGAADALANAYGIHLNPLTAAVPAAPAPSFDQQLDQALGQGGAPPRTDIGPAGYPKSQEPISEGPQESPELEERMQAPKPNADLESLMGNAHSIAPAAEASREEALKPTNPLFEAVIGGHHYPLPSQAPGTGLGDKYDKIYQSLIQSGAMSPTDALKHVSGLFSDDNKAGNIASRTADEIKLREAQKEEYGNKFALTAKQRQGNIETAEHGRNARNAENNKTRLEADALMGGPRQEQADTGKRAQYMGAVKEAKAAAGANADIKTLKNIEKIDEEIGNKSLVAQNAAKDTLAQIAQGGKASLAVMRQFDNSLSLPQKIEDEWYQKVHGTHSPKWLSNYREAVGGMKSVFTGERARVMEAFRNAAGSQSQYSKDPDLADYVRNEEASFAGELGEKPSGPSKSQQLLDGINKLTSGK